MGNTPDTPSGSRWTRICTTRRPTRRCSTTNRKHLSELVHTFDKISKQTANDKQREEREGLCALRHELRQLRRMRSDIEDVSTRRRTSEVLWKYSKAFKRVRHELLDNEQFQVGRLGRWSKRRRQLGRRLLLVHLEDDSGNNIPRVAGNAQPFSRIGGGSIGNRLGILMEPTTSSHDQKDDGR